jgi:hypothetical protein
MCYDDAMKTITYMIGGLSFVYSRVGSEVAIPMLEYDKMGPENGYAKFYRLEKGSIFDLGDCDMIRTRKIPLWLKNKHREFWGMKPLKSKKAKKT